MISFITLCFLVAAALGSSLNDLGGRIIGGDDVDITQYPYQLSLESYGSHNCGGSVISPHWALTAAHCTDAPVTSLALRAGTSLRGTGGSLHQVQQKIAHSWFNPSTFDYDIALLKVLTPFVFGDSVAAIRLPSQNERVETGASCTVTGWGTTVSGGSLSPQLQAVVVPIFGQTECQLAYLFYNVTERMICAGKRGGGVGSCKGDSGGPLVNEDKMVGIVSWGVGCALASQPGVYTRVASLRDWITENSSI